MKSVKRHCKECGKARWGTEKLGPGSRRIAPKRKTLVGGTIIFKAHDCGHVTVFNRDWSLKV